MFEPIREIKEMTPLRRKNVTQRLVDGLRGYRAQNLFVATEPVYLAEADALLSAPLTGGNVLYAARAPADVPAGARVPILLLSLTNDLSRAAVALTDDDAEKYSSVWKTSMACS